MIVAALLDPTLALLGMITTDFHGPVLVLLGMVGAFVYKTVRPCPVLAFRQRRQMWRREAGRRAQEGRR